MRTSSTLVHRHSASVRITHWVNALCMLILLMSGFQIFNAHPALYWGDISNFEEPVLAIGTSETEDGETVGVLRILDAQLETTGFLGLSNGVQSAIPGWATIPAGQSLAVGRRWHLFFAWLLVVNATWYVAHSALSRHLWRDLIPSGRQLRHMAGTVRDHLLLRFHQDEGGEGYNVLQKLAYLTVIFVVAPLILLTGLSMSPQFNAAFPEIVNLFGGRQSARTIHFIAAFMLVGFTIIHVTMVLLSGPWNHLRAMVTGRYQSARGRCLP